MRKEQRKLISWNIVSARAPTHEYLCILRTMMAHDFLQKCWGRVSALLEQRSEDVYKPTAAGQRNMKVFGERDNAHLSEYSTLKSFGIFFPKRFEPECSSSVV